MIPELDELISYLENQIDSCQNHWHNIKKNLQLKLSPLLESINEPCNDELMCKIFMQYLITGESNESLSQFISKEIYDCKIIPKLDDVSNYIMN